MANTNVYSLKSFGLVLCCYLLNLSIFSVVVAWTVSASIANASPTHANRFGSAAALVIGLAISIFFAFINIVIVNTLAARLRSTLLHKIYIWLSVVAVSAFGIYIYISDITDHFQ